MKSTQQLKETNVLFLVIVIFANNGHNRTTYYVSDNFIQVRITNGTILNETYYYANGKLVAKKDNSGNKQFYHPDHLD